MLVEDLVVKDVVSLDIKKDVLDALFTMFSNRQRILPVFDESKFVGTVSISNYAKVLRDLDDRKPESIHVSEIMDEKLTTISPTTEIPYVIDKLCERGIYGVPILSGHKFIGMVRREDILKHFLHLLKGKFKVMDVMSYYVSTNSIHDTIESVAKKMTDGGERRIVIMNDKKVEGIITLQDLANVLLAEKADLSTMSIRDILVPNMVAVSKSDNATKAGNIMLEWHISGVPVIDGQLDGIVGDKHIISRLRFIL